MNTIIYFTQKGLDEKRKEYDKLLQERPDAVKELAKAREMGDLSENGYYKGARFKLSQIDRDIRHLKYILKMARVKEPTGNGIDIGSTVTLSNGQQEKTYEIVGTYESNPSLGKISLDSPLGKLLKNKKEGDNVELLTGDKKTTYTITQTS
ncbi:MAG TPA: GreA/GreB family elongation factor [Patescibacteria group bacterium]|nr:GreA/GreB family elongation factor [Patescibacteria group bacterium]